MDQGLVDGAIPMLNSAGISPSNAPIYPKEAILSGVPRSIRSRRSGPAAASITRSGTRFDACCLSSEVRS